MKTEKTNPSRQPARIDDVIRKPYALADVLNRAHVLLAAQPELRETVTV